METFALITGESNSSLELSHFHGLGEGFCQARVVVKSSWYEASVIFESSLERVNEFVDGIEHILLEDSGTTNFINEESNFDLDISLSPLGSVLLNGILCNSMINDVHIKYEIKTDRVSLESFKDTLKYYLHAIKT